MIPSDVSDLQKTVRRPADRRTGASGSSLVAQSSAKGKPMPRRRVRRADRPGVIPHLTRRPRSPHGDTSSSRISA
jgi:hypothetical protein